MRGTDSIGGAFRQNLKLSYDEEVAAFSRRQIWHQEIISIVHSKARGGVSRTDSLRKSKIGYLLKSYCYYNLNDICLWDTLLVKKNNLLLQIIIVARNLICRQK